MKNKKVLILLAILLVALVSAAAIIIAATSADTQTGAKTITVDVVDKDGKAETFTIKTDAGTLAEAMVEAKLVPAYEDGGMYLTINGITADWNVDQGWWNICKDGTPLAVGMNDQAIADGEHYEAVYTIGF